MKTIAEVIHPQFEDYLDQWLLCRDCYEGEARIKQDEKATDYLPRLGGQESEDYELYLTRAVFFSVLATVVNGRVGQVFRKSPLYEFDDNFQNWMDEVSQNRLNLVAFTKKVLSEVLKTGRIGVLVDMGADGFNPYLTCFMAEDITNWEQEDTVLRSVTLCEHLVVDKYDDKTGHSKVREKVYRYLGLDEDGKYYVQIYRWQDGEYIVEDEFYPSMNGQQLDFIPFVFINTNDISSFCSKPPLYDLASLNLAHYRNSADYEQVLHMTAVPTPYGVGLDEDEGLQNIGPREFKAIRNPDAKLSMLEFSGKGSEALRQAMEEKVNAMTMLGGAIVQRRRGQVESAESARIRASSENSLLETICESVEQGMEQVLSHVALWAGWTQEDIEVKLNRDFINDQFDPATLKVVNEAETLGLISKQVAFDLRKRMEVYPDHWTFDEEQELLDSGIMPDQGEEEPTHTMDPLSHVVEEPDGWKVVDVNGNAVAYFNSREEAEAYAVANHDALMGNA